MSVITVTVGSYTYDETQIIINPTISKSICSGGFSVGNTACGCLKVGVPNNGHSEGDSVKISYNGNQIMGEFFISDIEKCGYAKLKPTDTYKTQMVMLTCYDGMSKLDDYMSFDLTTVTPADICDEIESQTGYLFEDGSKLGSSFDITKEEAESRTMREWLGIFGCYVGCNWSLRTYWLNDVLVSRITQLPLYYSGYSFSAIINAPVIVENAVTFSRVVSRGKDGTFKSGTDSDYTLEISCQYATQDSNDIIQSNIENQAVPYTAFKCDKLKADYVSMDIGDEITLSGHSGGLKIYNQTVTISVNGIYMSVGADVQKKTLKEDIEYSSEELKPITDFAVSVSNGVATLTWKNPTKNFTGVILKRKASTNFNNIFEGDTIYTGNAETFADTLPNDYTTYYYRILSYIGDDYNGDCETLNVPAASTLNVKEIPLTYGGIGTAGRLTANIIPGMLRTLFYYGETSHNYMIVQTDDYDSIRQCFYLMALRQLLTSSCGISTFLGWTLKIEIDYVKGDVNVASSDCIGLASSVNSDNTFDITDVIANGTTMETGTISYALPETITNGKFLVFQLFSSSSVLNIKKIWLEKVIT